MADNPDDEAFAEWNKGLEAIEPLIEYYSRQMGQLSGRLMTALSFLADLENGHDWDNHTAQVRESVHYARLLVASVLKIVVAAQEAEQGHEGQEAAAAMREALNRFLNGKNGGQSVD